MSDDSSDDDVPLSALGGKKGKKEESSDEEVEFGDGLVDSDEEEAGDDDEQLDSDDFIVEEDDDDDEDGDYGGGSDSDDDDDVPLSAMKSKKEKTPPKKKAKKESKSKAKPAKKAKSAKKEAPKKKASSSAKKKKSTATTTTKKSSTAGGGNWLCASGELYSQCDKGKLIQEVLKRWWHAYEWPDPKDLPATTPKGYDALDGFPGMYICTEGLDVGKFLDKRNHAKSPSFNNMAKKSAEELRGMLLNAITNQTEELQKAEGNGTATEKNLKTLEKWAMKLNCTKADKEAEKVLKAQRLTLS